MNAQNPDLNAIRQATRGRVRAAARAQARGRTWSVSEAARVLAAALLLTVALVFTVTATTLARLWIGDHGVTDGKQWPVLRAIGITADRVPASYVEVYLTRLESKMLLWLLLVALAAAALRRIRVAVVMALLMGFVYGSWWASWPSITLPASVAELIRRQATLAAGTGIWDWLLACGAAAFCVWMAVRARG